MKKKGLDVSTLTFESFSIEDTIVKGLKDVGYTDPTPLQKSVIPVALEKNDLIVKARSGMGKNGSFIIPVLQHLAANEKQEGTRALILTPEVETAQKIDEMIWAIGYHAQIESTAIDMKGNRDKQAKALDSQPPVIVANPGRLESLMSENRLMFKNIEVLVIDEAETIEKIGIISQVRKILERISGDPQTLFYAAEFTEKIKKLAKLPVKGEAIYIGFDIFKDVEELDDVENMGLKRTKQGNGQQKRSSKSSEKKNQKKSKSAENTRDKSSSGSKTFSPSHLKEINQGYIHVPGRTKISTLMTQLERSSGSAIIFTASKRGTDRLFRVMRKNNKNVTSVFGKLSNKKRDERLEGFKEGNYRYLLVADLTPDELGIKYAKQVINYDVPNEVEDYVDRTRLVSRKDSGTMVSLVSKQDREDIEEIVRRVTPSPQEWRLPDEVQKKKEKSKSGRSSKQGKKGKSNNSRATRKRRKDDDLELPKPSFDKLSGGRQGRKKEEKEDSAGLLGFVKKLFS